MWEVFRLDKNKVIMVQNSSFPEYEDIRKAILEAKEKVVTTVNATMVAAVLCVFSELALSECRIELDSL